LSPSETELAALSHIEHVEIMSDNRFRLSHAAEHHPAENIAELAAKNNWELFELTPGRKTLEQIFVELTSNEVIADETDMEIEKGASAA